MSGQAAAVGFTIRGIPVAYDVRKPEITCTGESAPLLTIDRLLDDDMIVDRVRDDLAAPPP